MANELSVKVKIAKLEDENLKLKEDKTNLISKYNALVKKYNKVITGLIGRYVEPTQNGVRISPTDLEFISSITK